MNYQDHFAKNFESDLIKLEFTDKEERESYIQRH